MFTVLIICLLPHYYRLLSWTVSFHVLISASGFRSLIQNAFRKATKSLFFSRTNFYSVTLLLLHLLPIHALGWLQQSSHNSEHALISLPLDDKFLLEGSISIYPTYHQKEAVNTLLAQIKFEKYAFQISTINVWGVVCETIH